jgi:ATP-dependent RNA helicase DeaD
MTTDFQRLGLAPDLVQAVTILGYEQPTPIQASAIPVLLAGRDVLGQAQTGTGKTAAFALPMLQACEVTREEIQSLVLVPTRELATQVADAIYRYGHHRGIRVLPVYGGQSYDRQLRRLERGVHVVVGTPGRLLDLRRQGALRLDTVRFLVLDEADAMLQMGFIEDVETLLGDTPVTRQTALFSATLPTPIRQLAMRHMREPLTIALADKTLTVSQTVQRYYVIPPAAKVAALSLLLEAEDIHCALIFTQTRVGAAELAELLVARGYAAEALHGDLSQAARETVLSRFRAGHIALLVATDVGARGLDIPAVSHVVNYAMPHTVEDYVHRIGRTGRAGRPGVALTLLTPSERYRLQAIEAFTRQPITRTKLPTLAEVQAHRDRRFKHALEALLVSTDIQRERRLVTELAASTGQEVATIAAAAMRLARSTEAQRVLEAVRDIPEAPRPVAPRRFGRTPQAPAETGEKSPRRWRYDKPAAVRGAPPRRRGQVVGSAES